MQYKERDIVEFRPTISTAFTRPKKMIDEVIKNED